MRFKGTISFECKTIEDVEEALIQATQQIMYGFDHGENYTWGEHGYYKFEVTDAENKVLDS
jgi:hypothetical protein